MEISEALDYVRENHRCVLATLRSDGAPQLSPIVVAVDDEGHVIISSRETAIKVKNLRRDARAWLCVFPDQFFGRWVQVEGTVDIVALPDAMEPLVDYYRRLNGEHPDWDEYRDAMRSEQRCLVRLSPTRAGPDISG